MNALARETAVLVALNLWTSGLALAQHPSEQPNQDAVATEAMEADIARREADIAAKQARRQAEVAKKQAEALRKQADIELAKAMLISAAPSQTGRPVTISSTNFRSRWPYLSGGTGSVLVIPSAQIEAKDLLTINEDMNVMSRIFENNLQEARIAPAGGGLFLPSSRDTLITLLGRGGGAIQGMYLQGYGALFLMKVDFPLSAPPQTPQKEETDDQGKTDEVWEQMRQQIYEPQRAARNKTAAESERYDPQKVENLRTTLVKSLKHSANIRNLRPDESVVITITGSGDFAGEAMITTRRTIVVDGRRGIIQEPASDAAGLPTIIVIRAKKADIDGFAKGDLDLDQFRQRVQMLSYPLLGGTAASEDSADAARDALLGLRRR